MLIKGKKLKSSKRTHTYTDIRIFETIKLAKLFVASFFKLFKIKQMQRLL